MATENGSGGPRGTGRAGGGPSDRSRGPGGRGGSDRGGRGGPGDRGRGGREGRDQGGGGSGYRVVAELSVLEKALSKNDFVQQKGPLSEIVKALRSMRLSSLEQLDLNTRGRMITTLLRVARQPKPALGAGPAPATEDATVAASAGPSEESLPAEAAPSPESSPSDEPAAPIETAASAEAAAEPADAVAPAEASAAQVEADPAASPAPAASPPVDDRPKAYSEVMFLVGSAWRAAGEPDRAAAAYALSGKPPPSHDEPAEPAPARAERPPREARPSRQGGERPSRADRPERRPAREGARPDAPLELREDWQKQAQELEEKGRTRDAGRIHERKQSFAAASRLFEVGGDLKSALRAAASAKDVERVKHFIQALKPDEWRPMLEKAGAYEVLMELYVSTGDFDNVARLYERARQFDQAALAWERAGKFGSARKAFERAHDSVSANRMRKVEAQKLVERGDRLGAALVWMSGGDRTEALQVLADLPEPKAFRFMQRAKLEDEAKALAQRELEKAEAENKPGTKARWLELLGQTAAAAEAWEKAERKDRAFPLYEKLGDFARAAAMAESVGKRKEAIALYSKAGNAEEAARLAALPAPEPSAVTATPHDPDSDMDSADTESPPAPSENAPAETPSAPSEGS